MTTRSRLTKGHPVLQWYAISDAFHFAFGNREGTGLSKQPVREGVIGGVLQFVNRPAFLTEPKRGSPITIGRVVVMKPTDLNHEVAGFTMVVGGHSGLTTQAQRRRPRGAAIGTGTRCRRSLQ